MQRNLYWWDLGKYGADHAELERPIVEELCRAGYEAGKSGCG